MEKRYGVLAGPNAQSTLAISNSVAVTTSFCIDTSLSNTGTGENLIALFSVGLSFSVSCEVGSAVELDTQDNPGVFNGQWPFIPTMVETCGDITIGNLIEGNENPATGQTSKSVCRNGRKLQNQCMSTPVKNKDGKALRINVLSKRHPLSISRFERIPHADILL